MDTQYEREQAYWAAKQQKAAETSDRLLRSIYTAPEDKAAMAAQQQQYLQEHMNAKIMEREVQAQKDKAWEQPSSASAHVYVFQEDRPWLNPSMMYGSEAEERAARRKYEDEVETYNRRMAMEKSLLRRKQQEDENSALRASLSDDRSFFNVGANGGKYAYQLPERRRPNAYDEQPAPTAASAQYPPVWKWSSEEPLPSRPSTAAPTPTQPTAPGRAPWATEDTPQQQAPGSAYTPSASFGRQARPSTASTRSAAPWATEEDLAPPARHSFQPAAPQQVQRPYATQDSVKPAPAPFAPQVQQQRAYPWSWQQ